MIMGTRVGNIDANAVLYLEKKLGVDPDEMTTILNRKSGFLGVSTKTSDARGMPVNWTSSPTAEIPRPSWCSRNTPTTSSRTSAPM